MLQGGARDLNLRPFASWDDALESLAEAAFSEPLLLVLDEFPELAEVSPELEGVIRATWDRIGGRTNLRILLSGSARRTMEAMQEERGPQYGRVELALLQGPFRYPSAQRARQVGTTANRSPASKESIDVTMPVLLGNALRMI